MDAEAHGPAEPAGEPLPRARPTLEQFDATLDHLTRLCGRLEQAEQRFKQMTDECGSVLQGLVAVDIVGTRRPWPG